MEDKGTEGSEEENRLYDYLYSDLGDNEILAARSDDRSSDKSGTSKCSPSSTRTSLLQDDTEILKEKLEKLQSENDLLQLRISELYKTAKAEIERKDRMIRESEKEKEDILFRRKNVFLQRKKFGKKSSVEKTIESTKVVNYSKSNHFANYKDKVKDEIKPSSLDKKHSRISKELEENERSSENKQNDLHAKIIHSKNTESKKNTIENQHKEKISKNNIDTSKDHTKPLILDISNENFTKNPSECEKISEFAEKDSPHCIAPLNTEEMKESQLLGPKNCLTGYKIPKSKSNSTKNSKEEFSKNDTKQSILIGDYEIISETREECCRTRNKSENNKDDDTCWTLYPYLKDGPSRYDILKENADTKQKTYEKTSCRDSGDKRENEGRHSRSKSKDSRSRRKEETSAKERASVKKDNSRSRGIGRNQGKYSRSTSKEREDNSHRRKRNRSRSIGSHGREKRRSTSRSRVSNEVARYKRSNLKEESELRSRTDRNRLNRNNEDRNRKRSQSKSRDRYGDKERSFNKIRNLRERLLRHRYQSLEKERIGEEKSCSDLKKKFFGAREKFKITESTRDGSRERVVESDDDHITLHLSGESDSDYFQIVDEENISSEDDEGTDDQKKFDILKDLDVDYNTMSDKDLRRLLNEKRKLLEEDIDKKILERGDSEDKDDIFTEDVLKNVDMDVLNIGMGLGFEKRVKVDNEEQHKAKEVDGFNETGEFEKIEEKVDDVSVEVVKTEDLLKMKEEAFTDLNKDFDITENKPCKKELSKMEELFGDSTSSEIEIGLQNADSQLETYESFIKHEEIFIKDECPQETNALSDLIKDRPDFVHVSGGNNVLEGQKDKLKEESCENDGDSSFFPDLSITDEEDSIKAEENCEDKDEGLEKRINILSDIVISSGPEKGTDTDKMESFECIEKIQLEIQGCLKTETPSRGRLSPKNLTKIKTEAYNTEELQKCLEGTDKPNFAKENKINYEKISVDSKEYCNKNVNKNNTKNEEKKRVVVTPFCEKMQVDTSFKIRDRSKDKNKREKTDYRKTDEQDTVNCQQRIEDSKGQIKKAETNSSCTLTPLISSKKSLSMPSFFDTPEITSQPKLNQSVLRKRKLSYEEADTNEEIENKNMKKDREKREERKLVKNDGTTKKVKKNQEIKDTNMEKECEKKERTCVENDEIRNETEKDIESQKSTKPDTNEENKEVEDKNLKKDGKNKEPKLVEKDGIINKFKKDLEQVKEILINKESDTNEETDSNNKKKERKSSEKVKKKRQKLEYLDEETANKKKKGLGSFVKNDVKEKRKNKETYTSEKSKVIGVNDKTKESKHSEQIENKSQELKHLQKEILNKEKKELLSNAVKEKRIIKKHKDKCETKLKSMMPKIKLFIPTKRQRKEAGEDGSKSKKRKIEETNLWEDEIVESEDEYKDSVSQVVADLVKKEQEKIGFTEHKLKAKKRRKCDKEDKSADTSEDIGDAVGGKEGSIIEEKEKYVPLIAENKEKDSGTINDKLTNEARENNLMKQSDNAPKPIKRIRPIRVDDSHRQKQRDGESIYTSGTEKDALSHSFSSDVAKPNKKRRIYSVGGKIEEKGRRISVVESMTTVDQGDVDNAAHTSIKIEESHMCIKTKKKQKRVSIVESTVNVDVYMQNKSVKIQETLTHNVAPNSSPLASFEARFEELSSKLIENEERKPLDDVSAKIVAPSPAPTFQLTDDGQIPDLGCVEVTFSTLNTDLCSNKEIIHVMDYMDITSLDKSIILSEGVVKCESDKDGDALEGVRERKNSVGQLDFKNFLTNEKSTSTPIRRERKRVNFLENEGKCTNFSPISSASSDDASKDKNIPVLPTNVERNCTKITTVLPETCEIKQDDYIGVSDNNNAVSSGLNNSDSLNSSGNRTLKSNVTIGVPLKRNRKRRIKVMIVD